MLQMLHLVINILNHSMSSICSSSRGDVKNMYHMYQRKCSICMELFEARKDYEKICYGCYHKNRVQNHKEEKLKFLSEISYLRKSSKSINQFLIQICYEI